jgi:catechol 2,3-dioxygenase-like lactoylglutathione lyase family enzyme
VRIDRIDHIVLTVADIPATVAFYERVLGMEHVERDGRHALRFGRAKINLHQSGNEFEPKAARVTPGSGDICLIAGDVSIDEIAAELEASDVPVEVGPVARDGATGSMMSVYVRDPDGNLVEISVYDD